MRIAIVGSNPSQASSGTSPFLPGTRSREVINRWLIEANICRSELYLEFHNIADYVTKNNRALNKSEIINQIPHIKSKLQGCWKVVALGKTAEKALTIAGIEHLALPHPSGLNRKLNDPRYVQECIDKLREYAK